MRASIKDPAFLGALSFFEAAARASSFQDAAAELSVTPSAVSHRISALELALGQKLFRRETRQVHLTPEGAAFAETVRRVLGELGAASERLQRSRVLTVSVGPYLSAHWLMARLGEFEASLPGVRVDLIHVIGTKPARDTDVAIIWDETARRDRHFGVLFDTQVIPVATPRLRCGQRFWEQNVTPIHYRDREAWRGWLDAVGGSREFAERGEIADDPNLVVEAAVHGRGVALGFLPFIAEPLAEGRLVALNKMAVTAGKTYFVDVGDTNHILSMQFVDWLMAQASATRSAR